MRHFLLIVLLIAILGTAGCIRPHFEEFNKANSLIESGASRITPLVSSNFTSANLEYIRVNTVAAKGNFSEAIDILDKIPSKELSMKDQTNLKAMKILIDANIKISDLLESNFSDVIKEYNSSINAPATCYWSSENPYSYETIDPFVDNVSEMKNNLLIIKSDITVIEKSINEVFDQFNNTDLSPPVLRTYNETGNRLIWFSSNIDNSITILEIPRDSISCQSSDFFPYPRYCSIIDWNDPECWAQAAEAECRSNADAWYNGQCHQVGV